jgi:uncharacterized integral membrane protein
VLDLRAFRRREDRKLVLVIMAFLVVVGGLAIGVVYGWGTAGTGVICLVVGAAVFGSLWLILSLIERWLAHEKE